MSRINVGEPQVNDVWKSLMKITPSISRSRTRDCRLHADTGPLASPRPCTDPAAWQRHSSLQVPALRSHRTSRQRCSGGGVGSMVYGTYGSPSSQLPGSPMGRYLTVSVCSRTFSSVAMIGRSNSGGPGRGGFGSVAGLAACGSTTTSSLTGHGAGTRHFGM